MLSCVCWAPRGRGLPHSYSQFLPLELVVADKVSANTHTRISEGVFTPLPSWWFLFPLFHKREDEVQKHVVTRNTSQRMGPGLGASRSR